MNEKQVHTMWALSLMAIGIATILLAGANILKIALPDWLTRTLGLIDFISLPVLVFSTVKKGKNKKQN